MPMFFITLSGFGRIGVEYWVLEPPTETNRQPTASFVNHRKPIVLTVNGQNQAELPVSLVRKEAELPYLAYRLICHVDCDPLTPAAKRMLFTSTREEMRHGIVYDLIRDEVVRILRSDDELKRLNDEARQQALQRRDEEAVRRMRREVARLLQILGLGVQEPVGAVAEGVQRPERPAVPRPPRPPPQPIELHEPPTYIRIVWEEGEPIRLYPIQRRYIRIETDARSDYHSRINVVIGGQSLRHRGSTPLEGGRMRVIIEALPTAQVGESGSIRVELMRTGLPVLYDERPIEIVERPPARPSRREIELPPFDVRPVSGPQDPMWNTLGWPENPNLVASSTEVENGQLVIYYSEVYPRYTEQRAVFERRDPALAESFTERYKVWLAAHSLLLYQDQQTMQATEEAAVQIEAEREEMERAERRRMAALSAMFAAREVEIPALLVDTE